jgi:hypothetical protein
MKTFKDIINEVAEPKGGDEKRFKAKHVVAKYDHPAAEDEQFTAKGVKKDKSKKASYKDDKDEEVYEEAQPKWKAKVGNKTYVVTARNTAEANRKAEKMAKKEGNRGAPSGKIEKVSEGYVSDAQRKAVHASKDEQKKKKKTYKEMFSLEESNTDKYMWKDINDALMKAGVNTSTIMKVISNLKGKQLKENYMMSEDPWEEVELDELSRKALANYTKKAARDMSYARGEMETNKDTKKGDKAIDRIVKRNRGITKATDRLAKEEVELDEAFKMGSMKLEDGSTVKLSKEEAEAVNELFSELNSSNKKRMEEEMMKNKSGFDKVLKFAKEAM